MSEETVLNKNEVIRNISNILPTMKDSDLLDILTDVSREPATTCAEGRDVVVTVRPGLDSYEIGLIQQIEKLLDNALQQVGFTRSTSVKAGHKVEFVFWQFAKAMKKGDE